jgi:nucleoside 2-deoxyribosyltransferase
MNKYIYLAGSINECTDHECRDWRNDVKKYYPNIYDPMDRDYRGMELKKYKEIVELDKEYIRKSNVVLVRYVKPSVGTSMEIFYAFTIGIPVVVWTNENVTISPWLMYHSNHIAYDLETSLYLILELL